MANTIAKIWLLPVITISFCTLQSPTSALLIPLISGINNNKECGWIKNGPNDLISCTLESSEHLPAGSMTCPEGGAIRISADYGEFHANCSAEFPIQFLFDGITPTEAIHVEYSNVRTKEDLMVYNIHVQIQSIATVWRNILHRDPKFWVPPSGLNYSRTGRYTFEGLESNVRHFHKTFYIFFEEPGAKPEFIRQEQMGGLTYSSGHVTVNVPCRPTHYNSEVNLQSATVIDGSKITGLTASPKAVVTSYTCILKDGQFSDAIQFNNTLTTGQDIVQDRKSMLKFHNSAAAEDYDDDAIANCTNLDGKGGPLSLAIQHVATQFDYKRLYNFALPKYRSRSHLVITKFANGSDQSSIITTNLSRGAAGITFCGNDKYYDVTGFSVDFKGRVSVFPYTGVENNLDLFKARIVEDPGRALRISSTEYNESSVLFDGDNVSFSCHFDAFYLCSPPSWVLVYQNGSQSILENVRVSLGVSNATAKLHLGLTKVSCSSSICGATDDIVSVSKTVKVHPRPTQESRIKNQELARPTPPDNRSTGSANETTGANSTDPSVQASAEPSVVVESVAAFVAVPILLLIIGAAVYMHWK